MVELLGMTSAEASAEVMEMKLVEASDACSAAASVGVRAAVRVGRWARPTAMPLNWGGASAAAKAEQLDAVMDGPWVKMWAEALAGRWARRSAAVSAGLSVLRLAHGSERWWVAARG